MADAPVDPRTEYTRRLAARRATAAQLARRDVGLANARLVVFLLGGLLFWLAFRLAWFPPGWVAIIPPTFIALMVAHDRTLRAKGRAEDAVRYYERALARLDGNWAGTGSPGLEFADPDHPYAADLDLFGTGSLFELLCTARTRTGQETLAAWLCAPAPREEVLARQAVLNELRNDVDLREDLALLGGDIRAHVRANVLKTWGAAPPVLRGHALRVVAGGLGALAYAAAIAWFKYPALTPALLGIALLELGIYRIVRNRVRRVVQAVEEPTRELIVLAGVLARLEGIPFASPRLRELQAVLTADGVRASARIAQLERLTVWLDAQRNQFFALFALPLLWEFQMAAAIETWRVRDGGRIAPWLAAVGELEALCALAAYAYEHPADPFPEIVETGPCFEGRDLGHPLLPEATCVRNDVRLGDSLRLLLVSGSNMSGKSTLLRTVGTNAVLAMAGAPVRAAQLRLSPLTVGASLRAQDSLRTGTSRFYAEIRRLRRIMDLTTGPRPVLYLLDELLHGTNSHDRSIGAAAIVRGLVEAQAIGLVTTHDLALARMVEDLGSQAANVHFADYLENGRLRFDYRLQPGVVRKSNALELMRAVGLHV